MSGGENRRRNPANLAGVPTGELNHSQPGSCPLNPEITGLRLTRKSRFAQVGRIHAEMWAAIELTQSHQVDGEKAAVLLWLSVKEASTRPRYGRSTRLLIGFTQWSMGPFAISNRGGLALWLF
jgi:hypothetical protein